MATKSKQLNSLANVYALNNSCWLHLKQVWKNINWNGRNLRKRNKNVQSPLSNTLNFRYYISGTSFKSLNMSLNKVYNPINYLMSYTFYPFYGVNHHAGCLRFRINRNVSPAFGQAPLQAPCTTLHSCCKESQNYLLMPKSLRFWPLKLCYKMKLKSKSK